MMTENASKRHNPGKAKIIYLHIPKTGGQSFNGLLERTYRKLPQYKTHLNDVLVSDEWNAGKADILNLPAEERESYGVFKGHMYFGLHTLLKGPCEYLTFLRDPVKRCVSHYQMLCREKIIKAGHVIDVSKPDWNLQAYPAFHRTLDNYQTRLLSGADPDMPFGHCNEEHQRLAIENMERYFSFVGLTEEFDLSLLLLRRTCDWSMRFYIPINVGTKQSVKVKPDVVSALQDLNQLDQGIYSYAQERMRKLAERFAPSLRVEHNLYRGCNALHQNYSLQLRSLKKKLGLKRPSNAKEAVRTLA